MLVGWRRTLARSSRRVAVCRGGRVLFEVTRALRADGPESGPCRSSTRGRLRHRLRGAGAEPPPSSPRPRRRLGQRTSCGLRAGSRFALVSTISRLYVEPGRSLVASHGVLLARVIQTKVASAARWLMIDAGMNDLVRPALYQAATASCPWTARSTRRRRSRGKSSVRSARAATISGGTCCRPSPRRPSPSWTRAPTGTRWQVRYNGRQLPIEVFAASGRVAGCTTRRSIESWAAERTAHFSSL
jgi:hypothetical protein